MATYSTINLRTTFGPDSAKIFVDSPDKKYFFPYRQQDNFSGGDANTHYPAKSREILLVFQHENVFHVGNIVGHKTAGLFYIERIGGDGDGNQKDVYY
jgi:hypothetical protein